MAQSQEHPIIVGTAGWSITRDQAANFAETGSALARYASRFRGVEINSSFYRRHRPDTWQRWHDSVPDHFRFAVKVPKRLTHELKLAETEAELAVFLGDIAPLGSKLGPLLVQLPPSLAFAGERDRAFFTAFRQRHGGRIALEPRHSSWRAAESLALLGECGIEMVHADPDPAGINGSIASGRTRYMRLHGSLKVYYSEYASERIERIAALLRNSVPGAWCIFDNTASGAALRNALQLQALRPLGD